MYREKDFVGNYHRYVCGMHRSVADGCVCVVLWLKGVKEVNEGELTWTMSKMFRRCTEDVQ